MNMKRFTKAEPNVTIKKNGNETSTDTRLTKYHREVIDGLLLGDGGLRVHKNGRNAVLGVTSVTSSFLKNVSDSLPFTFRTENRPATTRDIKGTNCETQQAWRIETLTDLSLTPIYERWYPGGGKKIVPTDIVLTPTVVKYWFYGDGSTSYIAYGDTPDAYVKMMLYTNGFTFDDCRMLASQLAALGLPLSVCSNRSNPILTTTKVSTIHAFFDYIGECDVDGFAYKWKRPKSNGTHDVKIGVLHTDEHKAKIGAGSRRMWARNKAISAGVPFLPFDESH